MHDNCVCLYVCVRALAFVRICTFMPVVIPCIYRVERSNELIEAAFIPKASSGSVCGQYRAVDVCTCGCVK